MWLPHRGRHKASPYIWCQPPKFPKNPSYSIVLPQPFSQEVKLFSGNASLSRAKSSTSPEQDWILQYVDGDPANSSESTKARKPLAAAEVVVEEVEGNPGYYQSKFFLRPHYQLEGLTVSLRLVSKLPSAKAA